MRKIKRFVKMFTFNFCSRFNIDGILKALISQESLFVTKLNFPAQRGALLSPLPPAPPPPPPPATVPQLIWLTPKAPESRLGPPLISGEGGGQMWRPGLELK